jgi:hypothetical protein
MRGSRSKGVVEYSMLLTGAICAFRALTIKVYRFRSYLDSVAADASVEASFYQQRQETRDTIVR